MYIVTSKAKSLKVDFDPEIFGMKINAFGKEVPFKGIKFDNYTFVTEDEQIINMLKTHPRIVKNKELSGRDNFWVETTQTTRQRLSDEGEIEVTTELLELSVEDKDVLRYLDKIADDIPMDRSNLLNRLEEVIERFGISSLRVPHIKSKASRISLVIHEVLDLLETKGIWPLAKEDSIVDLEEAIEPEELTTEDKGDDEGKRSNARSKGRNSRP